MTAPHEPPARRRGSDFSRLHPVSEQEARPSLSEEALDLEGKRALFSAPPDAPVPTGSAAPGSVVVDCGRCGEQTVLTATQWLALALPSLHLPYVKRGHGSWMRCPACRRRTWVSVQIQL